MSWLNGNLTKVVKLGKLILTSDPANGFEAVRKSFLDSQLTSLLAQIGVERLAEVEASNSATIDFEHGVNGVVIDSTYSANVIFLSKIKPVNDAVIPHYRIKAGGGFVIGANTYEANQNSWGTGTVIARALASSVPMLTGSGIEIGNAASESFSGLIIAYSDSDAGFIQNHITALILGQNSNGNIIASIASGRNGSGAMQGHRVYFSGGDIASGRAILFGVK